MFLGITDIRAWRDKGHQTETRRLPLSLTAQIRGPFQRDHELHCHCGIEAAEMGEFSKSQTSDRQRANVTSVCSSIARGRNGQL